MTELILVSANQLLFLFVSDISLDSKTENIFFICVRAGGNQAGFLALQDRSDQTSRQGNTGEASAVFSQFRELEKGRRQRQRQRQRERERHKTIGLMSKNNNSARFARAFYMLVHFFTVLCKTRT